MQEPDKHAVVIGGARGIGEAIVRRFAAEKWEVTIIDRLAEQADDLARELNASGVRAFSASADITDSTALQSIMEQIRNRTGKSGVTAAANSVGVFDERKGLLQTDTASFRRMLEINVIGAFVFSRAIEPLLAKDASLVHIGSINGFRAGAGLGAYKTSKAALHMMARCLALELARDPRRIRVNIVAPGWVDTPGERQVMDAEGKPNVLDDPESAHWIPLGRRTASREIADAVFFLSSPAGSGVVGQVLTVDCGISTQ